MGKFIVFYRETISCHIEIEADNVEHAEKLIKESDYNFDHVIEDDRELLHIDDVVAKK